MKSKQLSIFPDQEMAHWKEIIHFQQIVKSKDGQSLEVIPYAVTAEINERGYLVFSCGCEHGRNGKVCDHILRAISGDIYLPADKYDKSQRNALITIWKTASETQIYEIECNLYEQRELFSENNKQMKELHELLLNNNNLSGIEATKEKIKITREKGIKIKSEIMKLEASRDHLFTSVGLPLNTHSKAENSLRLLESLIKGPSDRSVFLPLYLPEDVDDCGWFLYPCSAFAGPFGMSEIERTKQIKNSDNNIHVKKYMVRTQSSNFSFAEGDIFYDTPIARHPDVSWGKALPYINVIVQIISVKNEIIMNKITACVEFTISNPHTGEKIKATKTIFDFIRYLINGKQ